MRLWAWIAVGLLVLFARRASAEPPDPRAEVELDAELDVTADVVQPYLSDPSQTLGQLAQLDNDPPAVPTGLEPGLYGDPAQPPEAQPAETPPEAEPQPTAAEPAPAPEPAPPPSLEAGEPEVGRQQPDPVFADWGEPGADAEPIQQRIHAALMFGVGASFDETPGGVNPLGFGFGLRGDYRLLPELAVGARFLYFVGGSAALAAGDISMASWLLAAEAAYRIPINGLLLEPGVALGISTRSVDGRAPFVDGRGGFRTETEDRTEAGFYLAPGATLVVPLALFSPDLEPFFAGGDARIGFVFGDEVSGSFELMVQAGLRF